jgi:hypothetical protein
MKAGRNDPCPCGSGRKYKKCCMLKKVTTPDELHYRRLSEVYDKLFDRLVEHAEHVFGRESLKAAIHEFWLWPQQDEEPEGKNFERQMPLFWPWFVFNWEYDPLDEQFQLDGPPDRTVAELYAENRGLGIEPLERTFIEAVNRKPYSFHEVLGVEPGKRIELRDVLTGTEITVQERSGSRHLKANDILFGRAVAVDGVGMIIGLSTYIIPPAYKPMLIELRRQIKLGRAAITDEVLNDWEIEIREAYLDCDRRLHTPPQLCNTDGDPLEFHKVVYDIDSADTAFEKLASLCVTEAADELRDAAEKAADGSIRRAELSWDRKGHKMSPGMPNTVLGHVVIDGRRLTVEVNSAQRAQAIRGEIERRLDTGARFRIDEITGLDKMLAGEAPGMPEQKSSAEHEALMQNPEVRSIMGEMVRRHWEGWVDEKLPALGGRTPRKAVKTADGREAVEALLAHAERAEGDDAEMGAMNREGIRRVRELLGLAKPCPTAE